MKTHDPSVCESQKVECSAWALTSIRILVGLLEYSEPVPSLSLGLWKLDFGWNVGVTSLVKYVLNKVYNGESRLGLEWYM